MILISLIQKVRYDRKLKRFQENVLCTLAYF